MSLPKGDAAIRYDDGGVITHNLATKIFRAHSPGKPERSWTFESPDLSTRRTIAIDSVASDFRGRIRMDSDPQGLEDMLAALMRGITGEYFESLGSGVSISFDLVSHGKVQPDPDLWWDNRYAVDVHMRRRDGGTWETFLT